MVNLPPVILMGEYGEYIDDEAVPMVWEIRITMMSIYILYLKHLK